MKIDKIPKRFINPNKNFTAYDVNNLTIIESIAENTDKINETVELVNNNENFMRDAMSETKNARDETVEAKNETIEAKNEAKNSEDESKLSEIHAQQYKQQAGGFAATATNKANEAEESAFSAEQSKIEAQNIKNGTSGSISGVFETVTDLINNGVPNHVYLVTENGEWYYYDNDWKSGGVYQGVLPATNSIGLDNLKDYLIVNSDNLFIGDNIIDNYLVHTLPSNPLASTSTSLLSGFIPVTANKNYKIQSEDYYIGAIFFVQNVVNNSYENGICAFTKIVSTRKYGYWDKIDDKVIFNNVVNNNLHQKYISFTILPETDITHILFYVTKSNRSNYIGEHNKSIVNKIINDIFIGDDNFDYRYKSCGGKNINSNYVKGLKTSDFIVKNSLILKKEDSLIKIFCGGNSDYNIIHTCDLYGSDNNSFNFLSFNYTKNPNNIIGDVIKSISDDVAPIHINNSYMGGNHGYNGGYSVTTSHNKTIQDIGSLWTDNINNYVLLQVFENTLLFCSIYTGDKFLPLTIQPPVNQLYHISGALHINNIVINSVSLVQIKPLINNLSNYITVDNVIISNNDIFIGCNSLKIIEKYGIISIPHMLNYLIENVGQNNNNSLINDSIDCDCEINTTYDFLDNGNVVVYSNYKILNTSFISRLGGIQSGKIGNNFIIPYSNYNTLSTLSDTSISVTQDKWAEANFPPFEVTQLNDNKFFTVGYFLDYSDTTPNIRKNNVSEAININGSSGKLYPYVITNKTVLKDSKFTIIGYRCFGVTNNNNIVLDYKVNNVDYLSIYLISGDIQIPYKYHNKYVQVIKKENSLNISNQFIMNGNLSFSGYGHCVLMTTPYSH